jgi:prepilin peptidase CpaA
LWLAALLFLALAAAAVEDAWRLRLSNVTCAFVLVLALVAAALSGLSLSLWQNLFVFVLVLVLGTVAFSAGWLGGGDVKLLASLALWMDIRTALWFLAAVFLSGGLLALIFMAGRAAYGRSARDRGRKSVPYGIAIAVGAIVSFTASRLEQARERALSLPALMSPSRII